MTLVKSKLTVNILKSMLNKLRIIKIDQREEEITIEDVVMVVMVNLMIKRRDKIRKKLKLKAIQDLKLKLKLIRVARMHKIFLTKLVRKETQDQEVKEAIEALEVKEVKEVKDVHKTQTKDLNKLERIHRLKHENANLWLKDRNTNPLLKLCKVKILKEEIVKEINKNLLKNEKNPYLQKSIVTKLNKMQLKIVNQILKE